MNAQLQHPGIVPVHQVGKLADGRPFYTMKRVRGETLADVLKLRGAQSVDLLGVLGQFRRVCEAMAYAHAQNVLHRDLKPANVMVGDYGEVLLMDWGLAKVLSEVTATAEMTPEPASQAIDLGAGWAERDPTKGGLGTIPYMAPEQAQGNVEEVDKRSDVFGLGAILCNILTGHPPYIGANVLVVERKALLGDLAVRTSDWRKTALMLSWWSWRESVCRRVGRTARAMLGKWRRRFRATLQAWTRGDGRRNWTA